MRAFACVPLLLAACATREPMGDPAFVTFYGESPRLEEWRAVVVEGAHVHAALPGPCLLEELEKLGAQAFRELGKAPPRGIPCSSLMGPAHGGPGRLVLLLLPPDEGEEALAVEIPRLAEGEREKTFTVPDLRVAHERPAGERRASIVHGRATARRMSDGRYDIDLFARLSPGGEQVVARARPLVD